MALLNTQPRAPQSFCVTHIISRDEQDKCSISEPQQRSHQLLHGTSTSRRLGTSQGNDFPSVLLRAPAQANPSSGPRTRSRKCHAGAVAGMSPVQAAAAAARPLSSEVSPRPGLNCGHGREGAHKGFLITQEKLLLQPRNTAWKTNRRSLETNPESCPLQQVAHVQYH